LGDIIIFLLYSAVVESIQKVKEYF